MKMNPRQLWSRILVIVGGCAMLVGSLDPLEGSIAILIGGGLVTLGTFLGGPGSRLLKYWTLIFSLIIVGVAALWAISSVGGLGGKGGLSMWWGLLMLPYPVGAIMGLVSLVARSIQCVRRRTAA